MVYNRLFSIITVTRDDFHGLFATYESLKTVLLDHSFEWVIIDGGNCAQSESLIRTLDPINVEYRKGQDNGIYDAMNRGVFASKGRYIQFLNGGDISMGVWIYREVLHAIDAGKEPDLIRTEALISNRERYWTKRPRRQFPWIFHGVTCNQQALFVKRDLLIRFPFSVKYKVCGDYDFEARCYLAKASEVVLHLPSVIFVLGGVSSRRIGLLNDEARHIQRVVLGMPWILRFCSSALRFFSNARTKRALSTLNEK